MAAAAYCDRELRADFLQSKSKAASSRHFLDEEFKNHSLKGSKIIVSKIIVCAL